MVDDVVFGREVSDQGIRFLPNITTGMQSTLLAGATTIALSNVPFKGKSLSVRVHLPAALTGSGFLVVSSVTLNGSDIGTNFVDPSKLAATNVFDVTLAAGPPSARSITMLDDTAIANYQNVFGPHTPSITGLSIVSNQVQVSWDPSGEAAVTFNVYRDGALLASNLPAATTSYVDATSLDHATRTHCYSVESVFTKSNNASQHAKAMCDWGVTSDRVTVIGAQTFAANAGTLSQSHGQWHYDGWGAPTDTLTVANVVPTYSGKHLLQVTEGNGSGGFTTGITCAVKTLEVWNGATLVTSGALVMPQLGSWDVWQDSSVVPVTLQAGTNYTIVIRQDASAGNMSDLSHFALYGGTGGVGGAFDNVNISALKLLALGVP